MEWWLTPSDDLVREQAYLVARGVRPLALVGHCEAVAPTMGEVSLRLHALAAEGAIPFIIDRRNGVADFGYCGSAWALELLRWLTEADDNAVPEIHRHRILALLLGYRDDAVATFERQNYPLATFTASPGPAAR